MSTVVAMMLVVIRPELLGGRVPDGNYDRCRLSGDREHGDGVAGSFCRGPVTPLAPYSIYKLSSTSCPTVKLLLPLWAYKYNLPPSGPHEASVVLYHATAQSRSGTTFSAPAALYSRIKYGNVARNAS